MKITDILFPPKCVVCGKVTRGEYLCADCEKKYMEMCGGRCRACGMTQRDCRCHRIGGIDTAVHVFEYGNAMSKKLIYSLKHKNSRRLRDFLAGECKNALFSAITDIGGFSECVLTYVPRSAESINEYGFDQSKELCRRISRLAEIPQMKMFSRSGGTQSQKSLTSEERAENAARAYSAVKNVKAPYKVIIIDDVTTTGSTLSACARLAREMGAEYVAALTVAVTL